MRRYETIFIADNDLSEEDRSPIFEKLKDLIQQHSGLLVMVDEWGSKKLAYEIKKKVRGYYVRLDYCGSGILVNEIERFFRIDDRILKYMTVLLDKDVDIEAVKEEIARAEEIQTDETESSEAETDAEPDAEPDAESNAADEPEPETLENK
jgi:small subunit ribosomal protein S6